MNAGRGDLPRLLDDLEAGRLTRPAPLDYVVLLQEAVAQDGRDVRVIAGARGLSAHYSPVRRSDDPSTSPRAGRISGNAIVSTQPLMDTRVVDLPRERQPRTAVIAAIVVAGQRLFVVSTHLENRLGWLRGLFGDRARERQADALLAGIPPQAHGILGGDINTMLGPTEPAWRALLERFPDTPADPEPTFRDRLVLDHLFFDLPKGWTATRRVLPERYGSDHHPVLGVVRHEEHEDGSATKDTKTTKAPDSIPLARSIRVEHGRLAEHSNLRAGPRSGSRARHAAPATSRRGGPHRTA